MKKSVSILGICLALVLILGSVLTGCTGSAPVPTAKPAPEAKAASPAPKATVEKPAAAPKPGGEPKGGAIVIALSEFGSENWQPHLGPVTNKAYADLLFDYLTYMTPDMKLSPGLATKWEMSKDGLTWTFDLRKDVKFTNGDPLTAEDVKFTFDLIMSKASTSTFAAPYRETIKSIEIPDPYRIVFQMKNPDWTLAYESSTRALCPIIPKKYYEKVGADEFEKRPVGSGPYKLVEHKRGEYVKLEANPGYWRLTPGFKTITLKPVREESTRIAMLRTGEADIIDLAVASKKEVETAGFSLRRAPGAYATGIGMLGMWLSSRPTYDAKCVFLDKRVREALCISINRQEIADHVFMGAATPAANYPWGPGLEGWDPNWKPYPFDPERAKKLLADAGYPEGKGLTVKMWLYPMSGVPDLPAMMEAVGMYWSKLGIKVVMEVTQYDAVRPKYQARSKDMVNTLMPRRDAQMPTFLSKIITGLSSKSVAGPFEDEQFEKLVMAGINEVDPQKRSELSRQAGQYIKDNFGAIPIAYVDSLFAANKKIGDWPQIGIASLNNLENCQPAK